MTHSAGRHHPISLYSRSDGSYPDAVFLLVLLPVASGVTEHQAVTRHPVRAPRSALRGHRCDLHSASQVQLEPLLSAGICWGPTTGSWKWIRESCCVILHGHSFPLSGEVKPFLYPKIHPACVPNPLVLFWAHLLSPYSIPI